MRKEMPWNVHGPEPWFTQETWLLLYLQPWVALPKLFPGVLEQLGEENKVGKKE